ncbi:hypothetical protein B0A55_05935 [Friedmanniomyces simplex]|uniref:Uncharacterized protein n=1 Tax=Friedmanniomyces simplex TaxID=329884 RepID=A0A4U0XFV2_9PEZI|nr:hypothetical protein B0A55_05935 [Friedmanniomyces simplex]
MASSSRRPTQAQPAAQTSKARHSPEAFKSLYERSEAAEALQRYEVLSWYSFIRCESLTQTRLHFQNIVAGFSPEDEAALVQCKEDSTPHPPRPGEGSRKGKERERERVSFGPGAIAGPSESRAADAVSGNDSPMGTRRVRERAGAGAGGSEMGGGNGYASASLGKKKRRSGGE